MRLVRLQHSGTASGSSTSNYSINFNPPFVIPANSEVALQNLTLKLVPDTIPITADTSQVAYSLFPPEAPEYDDYIDDHTATLTIGDYTIPELGDALTDKLNRELFYVGVGVDRNEQGAELFSQINPVTNVASFTFAARTAEEFSGPPTVEVDHSATYNYGVAGSPSFGQLDRAGATVSDVDSWLTTKNVWCRGSGAVQIVDPYDYHLPGSWSGGGTIWTSDAAFAVADLGFGDDDPFFTTLSNPDTYAGTITGGGANPIVITLVAADGPPDGTADNVVLQAGTGWVLGVIKTQYLSDLDNINIEDIEYGIALPNKDMTDSISSPFSSDGFGAPGLPSKYYVKGNRDAPWNYYDADGQIPLIDQPCVKMILGKQRSGVADRDKYGVHIEEFSTDSTTFEQTLADFVGESNFLAPFYNYEYGNYNLIVGMCKTGGSLSNIRWTSSKINNPITTSSGYYARAAPDLLLRDDGLIVPHASGLEFFNTFVDVKFHMDFLNETTSSFFGFGSVTQPQSDLINSSSTLTVSVVSPRQMNFQYSFSENITVMINLPLDTYDGAEQRNAVAFVPFGNLTTVNDTLTYSPPFPNFCGIRNKEETEISILNIRLLNDSRVEIQPQISVSTILLIRGG
jgi:hypothetical protein